MSELLRLGKGTLSMSNRSRPSFFYFPRLLRVHFYTSSLDKLAQAKYVFERAGCKLEHYRGKTEPYDEDYSDGTQSLLEKAVKQVRDKFFIRSIFFVEDTSLRIEALSGETDYPGVAVKEWFEATSFADLDRELKTVGNDRRATVKSDIALHLPGLAEPIFFHGETKGVVAPTPPTFKLNPAYQWLTPNNFNGWFIPDGELRRLGELEPERSLELDFRAKSLSLLLDRLYEYNTAVRLEGSGYISRKRSVGLQGELPLVGRRVIAAIGPRCAGKTTFGDDFRAAGAMHLEASSILREVASNRGEVVQSSADAIAFLRKHGFDVVAREIGKLIELRGSNTTVITGLRTIEEIEALHEIIPRLEVISIEADVKTRFFRHTKRGRTQDANTIRDFMVSDEEQASFGLLRVATEVADKIIVNEGDDLNEYLQKIRAEQYGQKLQPRAHSKPSEILKHRSELVRSLIALERLGRAVTCEQIRDESARFGAPVRLYNTNRALKAVPELAERIESKGQFLRYKILPHGLSLLRVLRSQGKIPSVPSPSKRPVPKSERSVVSPPVPKGTKSTTTMLSKKSKPTTAPSSLSKKSKSTTATKMRSKKSTPGVSRKMVVQKTKAFNKVAVRKSAQRRPAKAVRPKR
jgi:inosine/xanthosine triphosphate pyrophosphatase family protein/dephospho-CoA kinase